MIIQDLTLKDSKNCIWGDFILEVAMTVFDCGGKLIVFRVNRKPIRHVYLKVKPDLTVEVSVPKRSAVDVEQILEKKRRWIEAKIRMLTQAKKIFEDNRVLYKGKYLEVRVFATKRPCRDYRKYSNILHIYENTGLSRQEMLKRFLEDETSRFVEEKARSFAQKVNVAFKEVTIKDTKRWAYCTKDGDITFSWRLIALPEPLAEYIVVHEILHLKHFNHSKQFKGEMARLLMDYKEREQSLKSFSAVS